jgi:hypothetical protein
MYSYHSVTSREDFLRLALNTEASSMLEDGATFTSVFQLMPEAINYELLMRVVYERLVGWVKRHMSIDVERDSYDTETYSISKADQDQLYSTAGEFWASIGVTFGFAASENLDDQYSLLQEVLLKNIMDQFGGQIYIGTLMTASRSASVLFLLLPMFDEMMNLPASHEILLKLWRTLDE